MRVRVIDKDGASTVYTRDDDGRQRRADLQPGRRTPSTRARSPTVGLTRRRRPWPTAAPPARYVYDFDGDGTDDTAGVTYANAVTRRPPTSRRNLTADGPGTVNVRVRVIDKDGGSNVYTADVDVDNVAPTATLADVTTAEGTAATVAFTGADDVSAADKAAGFTFEWDADGDGTFTPGDEQRHVPAPDGPATKTIKGAIIDRDGGRHEYTATLTVTNAAPTATITGPDAVPSSGADHAHAATRRHRRRHADLRSWTGATGRPSTITARARRP